MSKIYIEVPTTTNNTTVSVPCGKNEEFLWQFTVMFDENEYLERRIVTIMDNECGRGDGSSFQTQIVKNRTNRTAEFEYHINQLDIKADVKIEVFFSKGHRLIGVEW